MKSSVVFVRCNFFFLKVRLKVKRKWCHWEICAVRSDNTDRSSFLATFCIINHACPLVENHFGICIHLLWISRGSGGLSCSFIFLSWHNKIITCRQGKHVTGFMRTMALWYYFSSNTLLINNRRSLRGVESFFVAYLSKVVRGDVQLAFVFNLFACILWLI